MFNMTSDNIDISNKIQINIVKKDKMNFIKLFNLY